jgi:acyl-CoA synthetase (AMP-forming)/AMP-acid ligase II
MQTDRARGELWNLLAMPQRYPCFFSGIGSLDRIYQPGLDRSETYSARVGGGRFPVREVRFHLRETRPESELVIEGIDAAWFVSVRMSDAPDGSARVSVAGFKTALAYEALTEYDNTNATRWLRRGIGRALDYLNNMPTSVVSNTGSVMRTVAGKGVVAVGRLDRTVRQLNGLARFGFTLAGGYAAAAGMSPAGIAVIDDDGAHTFQRIHLRSERLAAGLHKIGIGAGATVGTLARNHAAMVEIVVACGKLGVDLVMINTGMSPRQIQELAARHRLAAIFLDDEFDELVYSLPGTLLRISTRGESLPDGRLTAGELASAAGDYPRPATHGAQIVLTSGASGTPKAAKRPHPKGFGTVAAMLSKLPLQMRERMLIAPPLFHSWGLGLLQISTPMRATVVLQNRFDAQACLAAVAAHRCTSLIVVPIMLQRLLDLPASVRARYDTSSLRVIASCGAPLPGLLAVQAMDVFGDVVYNFYGSTEVSYATVATPADLRCAPATAGRPPLGVRVAILDELGDVLPIGSVGRIFVGNEMLFDGYLNAAAPQIADQLMDTGDLGYLDADRRLFVSGRDDEMIISGGENVFPRPVEDALAMLPQIEEVAVIGVPDDEYGQRLAAFVVPHVGVTLDVDLLRRYIRNRLDRFSVPRDIMFLDALPRNASGKILKRMLVRGDFDMA